MKHASSFILIGILSLFLTSSGRADLCAEDCEKFRKGCAIYECGAFVGPDRAACVQEKCSEFSNFNLKSCLDKCRGYKKKKQETKPPGHPPGSMPPGHSISPGP